MGCCWDSVAEMCDFEGQMSSLSNRVHLIKQMSLNLGSWASAFLPLTLTTNVCSEFQFLMSLGNAAFSLYPLHYSLGTAVITIDSSAA